MALGVSIKKKNCGSQARVHAHSASGRGWITSFKYEIYGVKDFQQIRKSCMIIVLDMIQRQSWKAGIQRHRHMLIFNSIPKRDEASCNAILIGHLHGVNVNPPDILEHLWRVKDVASWLFNDLTEYQKLVYILTLI